LLSMFFLPGALPSPNTKFLACPTAEVVEQCIGHIDHP
jgi:hypothetical protein